LWCIETDKHANDMNSYATKQHISSQDVLNSMKPDSTKHLPEEM